MIKKATVTLIILVTLFAAPLLWGHGIKVALEKRHPYVMANARYHGSKALVNASVTISYEAGNKVFQKGFTDQRGNFCFYPDKPGKWTVMVDDLTGHRGKKSITLNEDFFHLPPPKKSEAPPDAKESTLMEKEDSSRQPGQVKIKEEREPAAAKGELCCYLLKIILGALLILVVTYIFYRYRKAREASQK